MLLVIPTYTLATGTPVRGYAGWVWLLPRLFAQGGIAEEVLFRGYLFRHIREGRPFGRAAWVASIPFVAVHLLLFFTLPWPVAMASLLLSALLSFPLAYLFELGGNTVWAPALLHFVVQGAVKIAIVGNGGPAFPLLWMAASATLPFLVFLIPQTPSRKTDITVSSQP